jgi:2-polyprenyl-3-methyl-5-hydroxy-6-metoxy-1,4-benzoquinol methylase
MSQYKLFRTCPVCNADEADFIKKIDFMLFANHPMSNGYNVVQCKHCGFVYADTKVTQDDLDDYYKNLSKYEDKNIGTGGGFTQYDKKRLVDTAEFIAEKIENKSIRIADIGCANGGLLKELKNCGFTNLVAIDPSLTCIEITKAEVGCETYQFSIFDINSEVGKFDLIILSHVIEHILEVGNTMKKLNDLLTEGGIVYVECPNAQNYSKMVHAPLQEFNTEHINHFNEVSFSNLFGIYKYNQIYVGDKTTQIASGDNYHSVYGLFKQSQNAEYIVSFDDKILSSINLYIDKSLVIYNAIINDLQKIEDSKTIALFGIGQFAFKLLADPVLQQKRLLLFDNNYLNIGKLINGLTINKGADIVKILSKENAVIIITSLIHEQNIKEVLSKSFEKEHAPLPEIVGFKQLLY